MKNAARTAMLATGFSAALALAGGSTAQGQAFFEGHFPVPHGRVSIGFGAPGFAIGAFVPDPYAGEIVYEPGYGYGFFCDAGWVPVRSYGRRWIVADGPIARFDRQRSFNRFDRGERFERRDRFDRGARFDRFDRGDQDRRFARRDDNRFDRRSDRNGDGSRFHSRRDRDGGRDRDRR